MMNIWVTQGCQMPAKMKCVKPEKNQPEKGKEKALSGKNSTAVQQKSVLSSSLITEIDSSNLEETINQMYSEVIQINELKEHVNLNNKRLDNERSLTSCSEGLIKLQTIKG